MNKFPSKVTVPTTSGVATAIRNGRDASGAFKWDVTYPWGTDTVSGKATKVENHMIRAIAQHENGNEPHKEAA